MLKFRVVYKRAWIYPVIQHSQKAQAADSMMEKPTVAHGWVLQAIICNVRPV
jgi:hypothetical protein